MRIRSIGKVCSYTSGLAKDPIEEEREEIHKGLYCFDYDAKGRVVGIEILNLKKNSKMEDLTALNWKCLQSQRQQHQEGISLKPSAHINFYYIIHNIYGAFSLQRTHLINHLWRRWAASCYPRISKIRGAAGQSHMCMEFHPTVNTSFYLHDNLTESGRVILKNK